MNQHRRNNRKPSPVPSSAASSMPERVKLSAGDPYFPNRVCRVLEHWRADDATLMMRLATIPSSASPRALVIRRALADCTPLLPDETRLPAARYEPDLNPYLNMFG